MSGITPTAMPLPSADRRALQIAHVRQPAGVGGEGLEQAVLDDDRQTEGDEERRQDVGPSVRLKRQRLQGVADGEHDGERDDDGDHRATPRAGR